MRIDDTGLPISTSRVSTVARIGARIVALAIPVGARPPRATARRWRPPPHLRLADHELALRRPLPVHRLLERALRIVEIRLRHELLIEQLLRAVRVALRERNVGRLRLDLVLLQLRLRTFLRGFGRLQVRAGLAKSCGKILAVELGEHLSRLHQLIDVDGTASR